MATQTLWPVAKEPRGQTLSERLTAVAVEMWKWRAFAFGAISKHGGNRGKVPVLALGFTTSAGLDFATVSTVRHFHSDQGGAPIKGGKKSYLIV